MLGGAADHVTPQPNVFVSLPFAVLECWFSRLSVRFLVFNLQTTISVVSSVSNRQIVSEVVNVIKTTSSSLHSVEVHKCSVDPTRRRRLWLVIVTIAEWLATCMVRLFCGPCHSFHGQNSTPAVVSEALCQWPFHSASNCPFFPTVYPFYLMPGFS